MEKAARWRFELYRIDGSRESDRQGDTTRVATGITSVWPAVREDRVGGAFKVIRRAERNVRA
jgi:hypothetical protein